MAANLVVFTDEVYEHLVFDHARHLPLAGFDGNRAHDHHFQCGRCLTAPAGNRMGLRPSDFHRRGARRYLSYVGGAPFQPANSRWVPKTPGWRPFGLVEPGATGWQQAGGRPRCVATARTSLSRRPAPVGL